VDKTPISRILGGSTSKDSGDNSKITNVFHLEVEPPSGFLKNLIH